MKLCRLLKNRVKEWFRQQVLTIYCYYKKTKALNLIFVGIKFFQNKNIKARKTSMFLNTPKKRGYLLSKNQLYEILQPF
jgi:hypothetical protein